MQSRSIAVLTGVGRKGPSAEPSKMSEPAAKASRHYAFGDSGAARRAFGGRTLEADLAFLLPLLKPGMRILGCGCGGGGLAVQLARHVTTGEAVGFDLNPGAIEQAEQLAASAGCANVRFLVASVFDAPVPGASFDVAMFCGVLGHIPEPERALRHAHHLLKPGGLLAARDLAKQGDWAGGPRIGKPWRR
jgi:ubiquinone/menaquinone biosynthesis C-methylase UbiE